MSDKPTVADELREGIRNAIKFEAGMSGAELADYLCDVYVPIVKSALSEKDAENAKLKDELSCARISNEAWSESMGKLRAEIKRLKAGMCIFAREQMHDDYFENDEDVISFFMNMVDAEGREV